MHVVGPAPLVTGSVDLASILFCHSAYHAALAGRGKRTLERHFPGVEVAVVPTPVDTSRFCPDSVARAEVRRAERVGREETVAIFVGRDWELKGLSVAIRGVDERGPLSRAS